MANKEDFKLKVGDCVLYDDTSGAAYAEFGVVSAINDDNLVLTNIYRRKRVEIYPGREDIFIFKSRELYPLPTKCLGAYYKITKAEYNKIVKAFEKYHKCHADTCNIYRDIFFNAKRK